MNTERPDNDDDVAGGTGAAEPNDDGRDAAGRTPEPSEDAQVTPEGQGSQDQEEARAPESGTVADDVEASEQDVAQAPGDDVPTAEAAGVQAPGPDEVRVPERDGDPAPRAEEARAPKSADASAVEAENAQAREPDAAQALEADDEPAPEADDVQPREPEDARAVPDVAATSEAEGVQAREPDAGPPQEGSSGGEGGDAHHLARPVRRRSPAVIASVAAAVLLAGGGGAYLAASAGGGSGGATGSGAPAGNATPPPLALDGYSSSGAPNGIAPGEPDPNGVLYQADGALPKGPGSAAVHWPKDEVTEAEVVKLATALGLGGKPVAEGAAWRIGGGDGQGPTLQVNREAPGTWTFHRYHHGTDDRCRSTTVCAEGPATGSDQPVSDEPVSEEEAREAAAPILKAVGQDSAKVKASLVLGAQRVVNADPVVGGMPTYGWPTGVTVGAQGDVVAANGQLTAPEKAAAYPVLSAERTLELMNGAQETTPRAGIGGCASPVPLEGEQRTAPCEETPSAPRRERIAVEEAVFGLASLSVGTRPALVPAWLFEVRAPGAQESYTVTHPAIDPKYLDAAPPETRPSPRPSEPGDEPSTRDVRVEGYTAQGRELTVTFTGGVCADYTADAAETPGEVMVTVTESPWKDKVCIMIAKVQHRTVQLDEPLGDRKVVGADGKTVPLEKPGARLPR